MFAIDISDDREAATPQAERLRAAVEGILRDARVTEGSLSIAIVDDATIHELNRKYLDHDYPTDVLSFLLEREGNRLEGEVVVSFETAATCAARYDWTADDELLLYLIHGTLHLVGYDDDTPDARTAMRAAESRYLAAAGVQAPPERSAADAESG
jgi:probable rRNA maturation factor